MLWGRRIMRREMVWARENRNRKGLAHSKGWGSDIPGCFHNGVHLWRRLVNSSFHCEHRVLMWVQTPTFPVSRDARLCSVQLTIPTVA